MFKLIKLQDTNHLFKHCFMKQKKVLISFFFFCSMIMLGKAQEVFVPGGGDVSSESGSISYTIGQLFYTTNTTSDGSVIQGIQFPYEISVITNSETFDDIKLDISAYPNPVVNKLQLKISQNSFNNLSYQFFDQSGKILERKEISEQIVLLSLEDYKPATYLLSVMESNKLLKTFKIVKK